MTVIRIGDRFKNRQGDEVVVIFYESARKVTIEYQDEWRYVSTLEASNLRKGNFRNPNRRSIFGIGYLGVGRHRSSDEGSKTTKKYLAWHSMLVRCYDDNYIEKHPSYKDCYVCDDWHNFQNFSDWWEEQPNAPLSGYDLDKDLMVLGNKVYSPTTCSFVPQEINKLLCDRMRFRGDLPQGVCKHGKRFKSSISIDGVKTHIGVYSTPEEAYENYEKEKIRYVKEKARVHREILHPKVYENLMNWDLVGLTV